MTDTIYIFTRPRQIPLAYRHLTDLAKEQEMCYGTLNKQIRENMVTECYGYFSNSTYSLELLPIIKKLNK